MKKSITAIAIVIGLFYITTFSVSEQKSNALADVSKFNVINVQGTILFTKSGERMERGDIYIEGMPLDFTDEVARAAIINKLRGRYVLTGNKRGKVKVLPAANNISSRSGAILNVVDLKNHFSERLLIINQTKIEIGADAFPMNQKQFFYLTYNHEGEEIPKKLPFEENQLILDKEEIFKIDGEPIPVAEKEMTLYYHQDGSGTKINTFIPVFPEEEILKEEVLLILNTLKGEETDKKIEEVTAYLNEFYGRPNKSNLSAWLKKEFDLEK
ncbi:MAG: hypothetical protein WDZ35_05730 [Crocinitomicaceae bacterium]